MADHSHGAHDDDDADTPARPAPMPTLRATAPHIRRPSSERPSESATPSRPAPRPPGLLPPKTSLSQTKRRSMHEMKLIRPTRPLPPPPPKQALREVDPERKQLIKRRRILDEILSTEETYLKGLYELQHRYCSGIMVHDILPADKVKVLFSSVTPLLGVHEIMIKELRTEVAKDDPCVGPVFLQLIPYFKLYTAFVNGYGNVSIVLAELREPSSSAGKQIETLLDQSLGGVSGLESRLITPVQRVPRYQLLLRELIKYTPEEHTDMVALQKAQEEISQLALRINEMKRQNESDMRIVQISEKLIGDRRQLSQSSGMPGTEASPHDFQKKTFRKPTWCQLCTKFLYGAVAQGKKCKSCQFVAHHKCVPHVPANCGDAASTPTLVQHDRRLIEEFACSHLFVDPNDPKSQKNVLERNRCVAFLFNDSVVAVYPKTKEKDSAKEDTLTPPGAAAASSVDTPAQVFYEFVAMVRWYSFSQTHFSKVTRVSETHIQLLDPRTLILHSFLFDTATPTDDMFEKLNITRDAWLSQQEERGFIVTDKKPPPLLGDAASTGRSSGTWIRFEIPQTVTVKSASGTFIAYLVLIFENGKERSVVKRYSQFFTLQQQLLERFQKKALPKLPPKKVFGNLSSQHVQRRCRKLCAYLNELSRSPAFSLPAVQRFINTGTDDDSAASGSDEEPEIRDAKPASLASHPSESVEDEQELSDDHATGWATVTKPSSEAVPRGATKTTPRGAEKRSMVVLAVADFQAETDVEISLRKGEEVVVLNDQDPTWWYVSVQGRVGYVPSNYLLNPTLPI
mmetsp:Transcript_9527/g.29389  ORF Transcript_9527/g.29389 Transcript_9527/m.29389 type:complete len:797 (+) Transcript_9527:137-2527(+)